MDASYLRVKNWSRFQHYDAKRRRPPWIKFYNDLLGDDDDFGRLTEVEQWQLVRIWLIASRSSRFTVELVNEELRVVPVVAFDEQTLRRAIQSLKKIPLARFVREGWLIPVEENELVDPETGDLLAQVIGDDIQPVAGATDDEAELDPKEWRSIRTAVLKRDDYTCRYCGTYRKGERVWAGGSGRKARYRSALHVDHVIPKSKGGSDELENLVTSCVGCNLEKYNKLLADSALDSGGDSPLSASALLELENQRSRELEESTTAFEVREALERQLGAA